MNKYNLTDENMEYFGFVVQEDGDGNCKINTFVPCPISKLISGESFKANYSKSNANATDSYILTQEPKDYVTITYSRSDTGEETGNLKIVTLNASIWDYVGKGYGNQLHPMNDAVITVCTTTDNNLIPGLMIYGQISHSEWTGYPTIWKML